LIEYFKLKQSDRKLETAFTRSHLYRLVS
jgi:hypothetical protein